MSTRQQEETRRHFDQHAADWKVAAAGERTEVNVIKLRNDYVLSLVKESGAKSVLDVGCGTGELVCSIAEAGTEATGIDFAEGMIEQAKASLTDKNLSNACFDCVSVFDFDWKPGAYDFIAANGVIEYISQDEMTQLFQLIYDRLPEGGSFVFSARNRLFNLVSFNAFTTAEMPDALPGLVREAVGLNSDASFDDLAAIELAPEQSPETEHVPTTGIDVSKRFQYTPLQLLARLKSHGFSQTEFYPVHIHGVPPAVKATEPDMHVEISIRLQNYAANRSLLPFASAFMVHVSK